MVYDVVVIDTGVDSTHPCFNGKTLHGMTLKADFQDSGFDDEVGHGTAICNIISNHNQDASIFVIKVYEAELSCIFEESLLRALQYVHDNIDCKIVNMSLGVNVVSQGRELYEICKRLREKGILLISAFDNNGAYSFPAYYPCVLGVETSDLCIRITDMFFTGEDHINVCAFGRPQRLAWIDHKTIIGSGNSYACAHVAGLLLSTANIEMNIEHLSYTDEHVQLYSNPNSDFVSEIEKAVAFPYNKEIHSLVRFRKLLPFELMNVYDVKYSANVGASTNLLLGTQYERDIVIKNIAHIDWDEFDTLIVGHTGQLQQIVRSSNVLDSLISQAIAQGKRIYAFDDLSEHMCNGDSRYGLYAHPKNDNSIVPNNYGKLFFHSKPVLCVIGTSTQQGKYTLQLLLREKLMARGYVCGQIGTEPSAELFGMESSFHYGYNSDIALQTKDKIMYLNELCYRVANNPVDIVVTGAQSGTIITNFGNVYDYHFGQYEFLLGVLPDAIILCANLFDDAECLQRTISFVESAIDTHVIAIVLFPKAVNPTSSYRKLSHVSNAEHKIFCENVWEAVKLPVFMLNENLDGLVDLIINYFIKEETSC